LGVCYVLVFIVGFGTGSFEKEIKKSGVSNQKYYTTKTSNKAPIAQPNKAEGEIKGATVGGAGKAAPTDKTSVDCAVKGNIGAKGKKVYHIKGGAFYNIVKPEQCFKTEKEAADAGFVKSSR